METKISAKSAWAIWWIVTGLLWGIVFFLGWRYTHAATLFTENWTNLSQWTITNGNWTANGSVADPGTGSYPQYMHTTTTFATTDGIDYSGTVNIASGHTSEWGFLMTPHAPSGSNNFTGVGFGTNNTTGTTFGYYDCSQSFHSTAQSLGSTTTYEIIIDVSGGATFKLGGSTVGTDTGCSFSGKSIQLGTYDGTVHGMLWGPFTVADNLGGGGGSGTTTPTDYSLGTTTLFQLIASSTASTTYVVITSAGLYLLNNILELIAFIGLLLSLFILLVFGALTFR